MSRKISLLAFLLLSAPCLFAQQTVNISGKITIKGAILQDAFIELRAGNALNYTISGKTGEYKFTGIPVTDTASLTLKVAYVGYKNLYREIKSPDKTLVADFDFQDTDAKSLKEVVVTGQKKEQVSAYKSTYKINSKDFIRNTKANTVLKTVPDLSVQNNKVMVGGATPARIFINGIESGQEELKTINADDIDRVEVIANPSASYDADFTGAVVNIILKERKESFIKGTLEGTGGVRNEYWSLLPSLSFKWDWLIIKSYYSYLYNRQHIDYRLDRQMDDGLYYNQHSLRSVAGNQQSSGTKIDATLSKRSKLNISSELSGYNFGGIANGIYKDTATPDTAQFSNNSREKRNSWYIAAVYSYDLQKNRKFYIKGKYFRYTNTDLYSLANESGKEETGNVSSKTREITGEMDYEVSETKLFNKPSTFYTGVKYVQRRFSFSDTDFYINQHLVNTFAEANVDWTPKFSTMAGLAFENTRNINATLSQHYNFWLPTLNLLYHFGNRLDARLAYSRKIIRPSANNLNNAVVYLNPGLAFKGNENLMPQARDYYALTVSKGYPKLNIAFRLSHESVDHAIIETYSISDGLVINTMENAGKQQSTGLVANVRTKLFKLITANSTSGISYNTFGNQSPDALVKSNEGWTFRQGCYLGASVLKEKVALSLSGFYNAPVYSLNSRMITYPSFSLDAETNVFKDKLMVRLSYQDIFAWGTVSKENSRYNYFNQAIVFRNNTSNLLLTLSFNFGKNFNDRFNEANIQNDDIILKQ